MQRFFLNSSDVQLDKTTIIFQSKDVVHQLTRVLRAKPGMQVICLFNDGLEYLVELQEFSKKEIQAQIIEKRNNENELKEELILFQALPKAKDKWEFICQKATELGVTKIIPLLSERSFSKYPVISDRVLKIIREAAEQSERGKLPEIAEAMSLSQAGDFVSSEKISACVADSYDKEAENLFSFAHTNNTQAVFIGPEGGFSEVEVQLLNAKKIQSVSLGKLILRLETATITALSLLRKN